MLPITSLRCGCRFRRFYVRKSWRSGTSTNLPVWRYHTGRSRSKLTVHPCPYEKRLWVVRQSVTTDNHDATTYEPNSLHGTMRSRKERERERKREKERERERERERETDRLKRIKSG